MKDAVVITEKNTLPLALQAHAVQWLVVGGGAPSYQSLKMLLQHASDLPVTVIAEDASAEIKKLTEKYGNILLEERNHEPADLQKAGLAIIATGNKILDEKIHSEAKQLGLLAFLPDNPLLSDFVIHKKTESPVQAAGMKYRIRRAGTNSDQWWKSLTSKLILVFLLMVLGHIIISYLPLPSVREIVDNARPYFDKHFLFFILAGFLAQMVDGVLSMGYGVTSATCLMSFGVSPVAMSAAIHTSEIFTTGISGYSHYRFGNVNKKLFKHLVIPGIIGAVLGASLLVFLGDKAGKWLLPVIALYAGFLGLKILIKAFGQGQHNRKVKRVGLLAWVGGFLDSFGGGGWGPIVTSTLISKGRSPKYTVGSVSLTEFFVTLSSAFTFFITVGVSHWNIVLGLLIGGGVAAPIAARLTGKLPKKTMMIAVGIMVMIWSIRMFYKSFS
jgi:uncharacterized membrane protein YfcA